jgi:transposase InsO family protein
MKFAFIDRHRDRWPIVVMCRVLGVSRSGFFAWCQRPPSAASQRCAELTEQVRQVYEANRQVYGSPRVHRALRHAGVAVCVNTVAKLMRLAGIQGQKKRSFVPRTTDSSATTSPAPNSLSRNFAIGAVNRRWVSDITYVPTGEGWLYLAAIVDLGSRRVVGWAMDVTMAATLVCDALRMALQQRGPLPGAGMLHHSDRGSQYASDAYQQLLEQHGANASMSRPANCYDNAAMESFFATLKTELIHSEAYATHQQARASIFEYIEVFYNRKRLHSTLGYISPERFEASLT